MCFFNRPTNIHERFTVFKFTYYFRKITLSNIWQKSDDIKETHVQEYGNPITLVCFAQYYVSCLLVFRMTCMFFRFVCWLFIMSSDNSIWFLFILHDRYLFITTYVAPQWLLGIFLDFAIKLVFMTFAYSSRRLFPLHYLCLILTFFVLPRDFVYYPRLLFIHDLRLPP